MQRELKRVGCYDGEINAVWTASTKRAMKSFTDRVNASLPIEEPDSVLLALVQSHQDNVCGKPCPAGQGLSEAGRCLPNAILARNAAKGAARATAGAAHKGKLPEPPPAVVVSRSASTPTAAPATVAAVPSWTDPPPEGRMALAGPQTEGSPTPASPMSNAGVSVLPDPGAAGDAALQQGQPPPGTYRRASRSSDAKGAWARTFHKRRDSLF